MLERLKKVDPLIVLIISAVIIAIIFPARGQFAEVFLTLVSFAISVFFVMFCAWLFSQDAIMCIVQCTLLITIFMSTFLLFPIFVLTLLPLTLFITDDMSLGILFLTLVPSTVQSSVAFTSIGRGNVAGAIVAASASNLVGVIA